MEGMFSKVRNKATTFKDGVQAAYSGVNANQKAVLQLMVAAAIVLIPEVAFAQATANTGASFFCYIAQYLKQICGTAALVVICLWSVEHLFGVAKLHDVVMKVGMAAALIIIGSVAITNSGLTTTCVL